MTDALQLELNLDNRNNTELELFSLQKQILSINESVGKTRRRLFSEITELKKICFQLKEENQNLKSTLKEIKSEKTEWVYHKNGYLFDIEDHQKEISILMA